MEPVDARQEALDGVRFGHREILADGPEQRGLVALGARGRAPPCAPSTWCRQRPGTARARRSPREPLGRGRGRLGRASGAPRRDRRLGGRLRLGHGHADDRRPRRPGGQRSGLRGHDVEQQQVLAGDARGEQLELAGPRPAVARTRPAAQPPATDAASAAASWSGSSTAPRATHVPVTLGGLGLDRCSRDRAGPRTPCGPTPSDRGWRPTPTGWSWRPARGRDGPGRRSPRRGRRSRARSATGSWAWVTGS